MFNFTANDIEDKKIARDFLVRFYFNDVSCLYASPVTQLKAFVSLGKYKLFNWLEVHLFSSLFKLLVM